MELESLFQHIEQPKETPLSSLLLEIRETEKVSFTVEKLCCDSDFAEAFVSAVPDINEQKQYLIHTSRYELSNQGNSQSDPKYVLFFRRTLPSEQPKHEERWTNVYMQVRNGLKKEIPEGPHRLHSIILCDSLENLMMKGVKKGENNAFTDGEIVVNWPEYDQTRALCRFKPSSEVIALKKYLATEGARSSSEILQIIQNRKKSKD